MDVLLLSLVALAIACQAATSALDGRSRRQQTEAATRLVDAVGQTLKDVREQMQECHSFALTAMHKTNERLEDYASTHNVRSVLERDGILPWLLDPSERVAMEIKQYSEALGIGPTETVAWMASAAKTMVRGDTVNGATR